MNDNDAIITIHGQDPNSPKEVPVREPDEIQQPDDDYVPGKQQPEEFPGKRQPEEVPDDQPQEIPEDPNPSPPVSSR